MAKGKTIRVLIERASRIEYARLRRRGQTVYEVIKEGPLYTLKHYGTKTIIYDAYQNQLIYWYGESVSDRDSMNAFLRYMGNDRFYFRYGPVMGFKMEDYEEGVEHELHQPV